MCIYLVLFFSKCLITFYTISPYRTRNSWPCVARKLPGSAQVPLAGTQFLTLVSLSLFSLSLSLFLFLLRSPILKRICRKICISIASIEAFVSASAFHACSTLSGYFAFRCFTLHFLSTMLFLNDVNRLFLKKQTILHKNSMRVDCSFKEYSIIIFWFIRDLNKSDKNSQYLQVILSFSKRYP